MEFGLNEVLAIIIFVIGLLLLISEIKAKQASDLVTNIIIAVLLGGISIFNLVSLGFRSNSIILTIFYLLVLIICGTYTFFFIKHHLEFKKVDHQNE